MGQLVYLKDVVTLQVDKEKCTGCGMCMAVCPHAVLAADNGNIRVENRDACMECGACAMNCPEGAIAVQAGVGCATPVIRSALGARESSSCCSIELEKSVGGCAPEQKEPDQGNCC